MSLETKNELRKYLLAEIESEDDKTAIEKQLLTSDDYMQDFLIEEEELIQDYVDGHLTPAEQESFKKNFLITKERQEKIDFAKVLRKVISENSQESTKYISKKNEETSFWRSLYSRPYLVATVGLLLFAIVFTAVWLISRQSGSNEVLVSLNKAYSKERPFESRITSFNYAPANETRGGGKEKKDTVSLDLAKSIALKNVSENPSAENHHLLGQVYLAEREFDKSIEQLESAKKYAPENAQILSDLGTALFEKSKAIAKKSGSKSIELAALALGDFEKALSLDQSLLEARFNKAMCLQHKNMPQKAIEAWEEYLKFDGNSEWAEEARRNIKLLSESKKVQNKSSQEIIKDFLVAYRSKNENEVWRITSRNREMISGKLIPQQLAFLFLETNGEEGREYLSALKYVGELEKKKSEDSFWSELADFYSSLSPEKKQILREAQQSVKAGYKFDLDSDYGNAYIEFLNAQKKFSQVGDIWEEKIAEYWLAFNEYQLDQIDKNEKRLYELAKFCEKGKYNWLNSIVHSRLSLSAGAKNNLSQSIKFDKQAVVLAEKTSDLYQQQRSYVQLNENYKRLKQYEEAFENIDKSFQLLSVPEISVRQKYRTYSYSAQTFYEKQLYEMASFIIKEAIALNESEINDSTFTHTSYLNLGTIYYVQKEFDKAIQVLEISKKAVESLKDEKSRNKYKSRTLIRMGDVYRTQGDCRQAIQKYNESIAIYENLEFIEHYYEAKKNRLLCYFSQEDNQTIEAELANVLEIFEAKRSKILEEQNRNSFFGDGQNIYDLAVDYYFSKGDYETAFNYSETSRSRSLFDIQENGAKISLEEGKPQIAFDKEITANPQKLSEIRLKLPEKIQLVEYAVLDDKVIVWLLTKESFETFSFKISNSELEAKVIAFLDAIKTKNSPIQENLSQELYQILFSFLENKLDKNKQIFIIPDKVLFHLPFNALISSQTKQYLVLDYKISLSPSANVFLNSTESAAERDSSNEEKLLSVGNPSFDREEYSNLSESLSTKKEAKGIYNLYPNHQLLLDSDATAEAIKKNISDAEVFHFAGHYVINGESPLLSSFLVTGRGEEGKLTNYELFQQELSNSKLIVLSACDTGIEKYYKGEGMIGAGRTFLAANVPLVVASNWKVDFEATTELMLKFHFYRQKEKLDTVSALKKAQIEILNNKEFSNPYYWAGFSVIGGYAKF